MKYGIIVLLVALIGSNALWFYSTLDDALTCMYSDASYDMADQMYRQSLVLSNLNLIGSTVEEAKVKVGSDIHGLELFEKDGCLYAGQICMQISTNRTIDAIRAQTP